MRGRTRLSAEQRAKREWLAGEILRNCEDDHSLGFYRKVAATVPEHRVLEVLSEVRLAAHDRRINNAKGAMFTALIRDQER